MNLSNHYGKHSGTHVPCGRLLHPAMIAVCITLMLSSGSAAALDTNAGHTAVPACSNAVAAPAPVYVTIGKSSIIKLPVAIVRRTLGNDDIVQARMLSDNVLYLLGMATGTTNMVLQDKNGNCTLMDVVVAIDTSAFKEKFAQLFPDEKDVQISAAGDMLVLSGSVSDSVGADAVVTLAQAYLHTIKPHNVGVAGAPALTLAGTAATDVNTGAAKVPGIVNMLTVAAPQQVMLEVKVAEVSKTLLDSLGVDFSRAFVSANGSSLRFLSGIFGGASAAIGQISGTGPGGVPLSSVGAVVGGTVPSAVGTGGNVTVTYDANNRPVYTTNYGTVPGKGVTNLGIDAKHNNGLVKILAEPTVVALSGHEGSFLSGGKIFIPIVQNSNGSSTITLQEEDFGVGLRFTPTVLDHGRINLRVSPEVSELASQGVSVTASSTGTTSILPLITTRRATTTVQLYDGQSFIIGGLIKNNVTQNINAFPILGELPIIGALFRSSEFQSDKSELVFLITPHIAKALPPDYVLPTDHFVEPSRSDLFLHGKMEGDAVAADKVKPSNAQIATPNPATAAGGIETK